MSNPSPTGAAQSVALDVLYSNATGQSDPRSPAFPALLAKLDKNARLAHKLLPVDRQTATRLLACRSGEYKCRLAKLCVFCSLDRTDVLVERYQARLVGIANPVHLTLTRRTEPYLKRSSIQELKDSFKAVRESRPIRRVIRGGISNVELATQGRRWQPHIHAVLDCADALPIKLIRAQWKQRTGGQQVDEKSVRVGEAANTFAYSTFLPDFPDNADLIAQYHQATKGTTFVQSWGTLHHAKGRVVGLGRGSSR